MSIVNRPRGVPPFRLASVNPPIWLDCESHRAALTGGGSPTLFQDSGGTSAVTAVEQLTGLALDSSGGFARGPQLITNGSNFTTATGWLPSNVVLSVSAGNLVITRGATAGPVSASFQFTGAVVGVWYAMEIIVATNDGAVNIILQAYGNSSLGQTSVSSATGRRSVYFRADRTNPSLIVRVENGSSGNSVSLSLASVQSITGQHALQVTSPARPVLTARENLLIATEDFSSPAWTKFSLGSGSVPTVAPNTAAAPDGAMTADVINFSAPASGAGSFVEQTITVVSGQQHADAIQLRAATPGDVGKVVLLRGVAGLGYMPITLTADWVRYTRTETAGSTSGPFTLGLRFGFSGSATAASVAVFAAHRNTGATAGRYQRVTTATDYDISAAPLMLRFDGSDDGIASATFPAGTLPADADAYLVIWPDADEQESVLVEDPSSSGARYFAVRHPSQAIAQSADGPTTASAEFTANGSPIAGTTNPTRAQLFTATQTGVPVLLQITGLNLSAWTQVGLGRYVNNATGFGYKGRHGCLLIDQAAPDSERTKIRKALAKRYQIQGVV